MIAADEYFMPIWQVAKPIQEVNGFLFGANHTEIARMNDYVGIGQVAQSMMAAVGIGKM